MKFKNIYLLSIILSSLSLHAQDADSKIKDLINQNGWFALDKEFPVLKDSLTPLSILSTKVLLDMHFNRPKQALISIDTLLRFYKSKPGLDIGYFIFLSQIHDDLGEYAKSAELLQELIPQIESFVPKENIASLRVMYRELDRYRNEKAPELSRPYKKIIVPFKYQNADKKNENAGSMMIVPVTIHGKVYQFLFDTGCSITTISRKIADEIGVKSLIDSISVHGLRESTGHEMGILDSMSVGKIIYRHSKIFINNTIIADDSTIFSRIDGILGLNFMKAVGEMQIINKDKKIIFPHKQSKLPSFGRNLHITENNILAIQTFAFEVPLTMVLDVGMPTSSFSYQYYLNNKALIECHGIKNWWTESGIGGNTGYYAYHITVEQFKIAAVTIKKIENISVVAAPKVGGIQCKDGTIGLDFFQPFSKVILNLDKMFINFIR